jgi:serine/threonine protein phosphatase PrpC
VQIRSAGQTDVGKVRQQNEDAFLCSDLLGLYLVADGMGGHVGGKTASNLTAQTIENFFRGASTALAENGSYAHLPRQLAGAVREACAAVYDKAAQDRELRGMGTTCTLLAVRAARAVVAHVGDSRCYLIRQAQLTQITDDHSLVNEQIKSGELTREEARTSRHKNIITRSVGFERDVAVDTFSMPIEPGDVYLLCSDGLSNLVRNEEIAACVGKHALEQVPAELIALANSRGGDDNITVVCVQAVPPLLH